MAGIGIGLVWVGYTAILYGYCLFRGYDITPKQLLSSNWPPGTPFDAKKAGAAAGKALGKIAKEAQKQAGD